MADILRLAAEADCAALAALIARSARDLQAGDYPADVLDVAIGTAFGLDRMLVADGTYFMVERDRVPVACGGWSFRTRSHGADGHLPGHDTPIRPGIDPARVRAFFVAPECARQGLGSRILAACEDAAQAAGFGEGQLVATLAGERLYSRHGWAVAERYDEILPGGIALPVIRMTKYFGSGEI